MRACASAYVERRWPARPLATAAEVWNWGLPDEVVPCERQRCAGTSGNWCPRCRVSQLWRIRGQLAQHALGWVPLLPDISDVDLSNGGAAASQPRNRVCAAREDDHRGDRAGGRAVAEYPDALVREARAMAKRVMAAAVCERFVGDLPEWPVRCERTEESAGHLGSSAD